MSGCDTQVRSSGSVDRWEKSFVDSRFLYNHNGIMNDNGMNGPNKELMATESPIERSFWSPHQNGNIPYPYSNGHSKEGTLWSGRNGYNITIPHSIEVMSSEVNNNFEKSTPLKVVEPLTEFTRNLSINGCQDLTEKNSSIWANCDTSSGSSRQNGGPSRRRSAAMHDRVEDNGTSLTIHSQSRGDVVPLSRLNHIQGPMDEGFLNTTKVIRSVSSPSFQKSYSTFQKTPRRKLSEPVRNESSKYFLGHSVPIEEYRISNSSPPVIAESTMSDFGMLTNTFSSADHFKLRPRTSEKTTRLRRSPGVIGEERSKTNCRSRSFEESFNSRNRLHANDKYLDNVRQRSKSFGSTGDVKSCSLCKIPFPSKQQYEEHLQSTKHQNKIAKVNSEPYSKFCDYCNVGLNSKSQAQEHFSSGRHEQTVAKSQKAPIRNHPPLNTKLNDFRELQCLTMTKPRDYQLELYSKAMSTNSVCFLPTGTGKNLVSTMVVAHILLLNPTRQIIFLVDRVLRVLEQSCYLKRELQELQIPCSAKDEVYSNGTLFNHPFDQQVRPVRIGAICGEMRKLEPGVPIFNHDILVVTADCYRNHINNGTLRFEDSGLIVLDESHHCNKDHPYHVIIRDYYRPDLTVLNRPKILGQTSSAAGEPQADRTLKKLQRLLDNLGGATLLTVSDHTQELNEKTSPVDLVCLHSEYSQQEKTLLGILMEYATKCFNFAARVSPFKEYKDVFQPSSGGTLSREDILPILEVIDKFSIFSKPHTIAVNSLLHFQTICNAISALNECGEKIATNLITGLMERECPHGFEWAKEQELPCESLVAFIRQSAIQVCFPIDFVDSSINELISLLLQKVHFEDNVRPLVLVLVKRSQTAYRLAKYLDSSILLRRGIRTASLVGIDSHNSLFGNPTLDSSLTTLANIKEGHYHIVIATNLSETGLDLPSFQLVVQLDPPSAVSALTKIRAFSSGLGRTSHAVIARDGSLGKKVRDLLLKEKNMIQAAEIINSGETVCMY